MSNRGLVFCLLEKSLNHDYLTLPSIPDKIHKSVVVIPESRTVA
jgi:hypothetical protein